MPFSLKRYFTLDEAMKSLEDNGWAMFTREQMAIYAAHRGEIDRRLKEMHGDKFKYEWYWTPIEYNTEDAWSYDGVELNRVYVNKFNRCRVRPILNL